MKCIAGLALVAATLGAQTQEFVVEKDHRVSVSSDVIAGPAVMGFVAAGVEGGRLVKGAPYSGEATTETVRMLADGTRITNKNSTAMARDAEGRTRRETSLSHIGPWANSDQHQPPRFVTINDPVAKENYVLNLTNRTARKAKTGEPLVFHDESKEGAATRVMTHKMQVEMRHTGGADVVAGEPFDLALPAMPATPGFRVRFDAKNRKTESLGKQTMEGVTVEGTRTTHTIPEGEIGNDRPIVVTDERWYSPDLQMVIYSKNTDPQFGEVIYRVSNLRRGDPDPALFRIPAEFKVVENEAPRIMMRKARPGQEE